MWLCVCVGIAIKTNDKQWNKNNISVNIGVANHRNNNQSQSTELSAELLNHKNNRNKTNERRETYDTIHIHIQQQIVLIEWTVRRNGQSHKHHSYNKWIEPNEWKRTEAPTSTVLETHTHTQVRNTEGTCYSTKSSNSHYNHANSAPCRSTIRNPARYRVTNSIV